MQPKKLNKYLLPLAIASALTSNSVIAATADYSVGFTTVPDITITQVQAMDFGSNLALTSGATCTMAVTDDQTATTYPGDVVMRTARTSALAAGANVGDIAGSGCSSAASGTKGTIGIYEILGIAGGTVNVTVSNTTGGTDFNYTTDGCVGNYDTVGGNNDTCDAVVGGVATVVKLASSADTVGNAAGSGIPTPGASRIALGGSITTTSVHNAGETLTESFTITVTY